ALPINLTAQVRNIAEVTTAVARGDLSRKITVDVKGEILELKNTINTMVDQLNAFAAEVTRVAREVGTEGKLGGQAQVPGVAGTWKDLTDNVNVMATNLTEQVRGIVKVVTAVANGDLNQSLTVNAKGEVAALAETINNMTLTLATFADQVTTDRNTEQDWLKTNLARFTGMLQGQRDLTTVGRMLLAVLAELVNAHQGVIYRMEAVEEPCLKLLSAYADNGQDGYIPQLRPGEGLIGQCALEKRRLLINDLPSHAVPVRSGLFEARPRSVIVLPVLFEEQVMAVIELASLDV